MPRAKSIVKDTAVENKNTEVVVEDAVVDAVVDASETMVKETAPVVKETVVKNKAPRKYEQTDLILCRSVTPGWLGMSGRSGQFYVWANYGDECEVEYQDLYSIKTMRSKYLYDPLIVVEDEELLENPRWSDLKNFYDDKIYGMDNINYVLDLPLRNFRNALFTLPKGLIKALSVEVANRIEDGTFDSLQKIKAIDEVCGTDFMHILPKYD